MALSSDLPDPACQTLAISACQGSGRWDVAFFLLEMADASSASISARNAALSTCQKKSAWAQSLRLLLETLQLGFRTDVFTWTSSIGSCSRASPWRWSAHLMQVMATAHLPPTLLAVSEAASTGGEAPAQLLEALQAAALASLSLRGI